MSASIFDTVLRLGRPASNVSSSRVEGSCILEVVASSTSE
jgi:hypothetical protein